MSQDLAMPGFDKCDVNGDGLCNVANTIIARAIAGLGPGVEQKCHARRLFRKRVWASMQHR
jgi:hypothetical protein